MNTRYPSAASHLASIAAIIMIGSTALTGTTSPASESPLEISGIYPHLAAFNGVGEFIRHGECGIGAVVPWAGKLWFITYPPHATRGSDDKLYAIAPDMKTLEIRPESVGGTHACRMIHKESNQLIIGPYFIDAKGNVRVCDVKKKLIGRMTAVMRHLTDPANRVYFFDMEGAIYEVDVHTLEVTKLFAKPVPGWHGKGGYTAQGRIVIANNGENAAGKVPKEYLAKLPPKRVEDAGVLAEWDGKEWRIIERHQFTDVTGPGGIHGSPDDRAPLWAIGWDKRSVILKLLDSGQWFTFRVPKGDYAFDPRHGWFTEWPRIREVTGGKFLMVMHGQMFDFPPTFSRANTAGIRPVCTHLRYVPDVCEWNGRLVIASDDTTVMANPLAGQSQSNLWFGDWDELKTWGPTAGWGGVWVDDPVKKNVPSDPFLFAGYKQRVLHVSHSADAAVTFTVEADSKGNGDWQPLQKIEVPAKSYRHHIFDSGMKAEWVRLKADRDCVVSAYFHVSGGGTEKRSTLASKSTGAATHALIRPAKANRNLQVVTVGGYYEVDETLAFTAMAEPEEVKTIRPKLEVHPDFTVDAASVVITDKNGSRWRLPKTDAAFDRPFAGGWPRGVREVESERNFANFHGIFYEIPRSSGLKNQEQPDFCKMKPVAAHRMHVADFCTWRGLMVMSGEFDAPSIGRIFKSADGKVALWFGKTDDLWQLGKPAGHGGPWNETATKAGEPSDPFLMTNFARKSLALSHDAKEPVTFTVEVDFLATGVWCEYGRFTVEPGRQFTHVFPDGYAAHWVRLKPNRDVKATATFTYSAD